MVIPLEIGKWYYVGDDIQKELEAIIKKMKRDELERSQQRPHKPSDAGSNPVPASKQYPSSNGRNVEPWV